MKQNHVRLAVFTMIMIVLTVLPAVAAENQDMGGWERGGKYDRLYVPSERDSFKGTLTGFKEIVPFPGMSPGVAVLVKDPDGDVVTVHLGPKWFVNPDETGLKKGDRVKVKGVWVEINNEDVVIASKISRGDFFEYKVRLTSDGKPFWTMTKEEFDKERSQKRD
ncbi:MAG: hypothetical protein AB7S77_18770 [Desulfatirhabdiaceae bacterium]